MHMRLGEILVKRNLLSRSQLLRVLDAQRETGEPLGVLCERLCGVSAEDIEEAWAAQYVHLTRKIDPRVETFDERALAAVTRRQAWQFRVLPVRYDGDELMVATTARHLRRALRFATRVVGVPVYFVIAEPDALAAILCERYPVAGMSAHALDDDTIEQLLTLARERAA